MKITGGEYRGRNLKVPSSGVRPTQDRVRESIFNSLAGCIPETSVLDLFSGSGALGLEALSRSASSVCFVEQNRKACQVLKQNLASIMGDESNDRSSVLCMDALSFMKRNYHGSGFDIIFADPPYGFSKVNWLEKTLIALEQQRMLKFGGILVFELRSSDEIVQRPRWETVRDKIYGSTRVLFLRLTEEDDAE